MEGEPIDLYSDYLLCSKTLWLKVKKLVRIHENDKACLIFDDTIIEKQYMDENDIVCWHWDHQDSRNVKGINLLTAFYTAANKEAAIRIPLGYEIIAKTERYFDGKEGKEKRRSPKTKNELMQGFQIRRYTWKGLAHYGQKVFWSVIGYNLRVMTGAILQAMTL